MLKFAVLYGAIGYVGARWVVKRSKPRDKTQALIMYALAIIVWPYWLVMFVYEIVHTIVRMHKEGEL